MEEVAENSRITRSLGSNDGCFKENITSKFNLGRLMFYDYSTLVTLEEMGEEPRIAVFILEDALSVWKNLGKHSLFVWLFVSSIKTGTRCISSLD